MAEALNRFSVDVDDDGGGIVAARVFDRFTDDEFGRGRTDHFGFLAQQFRDLVVVESVNQAIRTNQEDVPAFVKDDPDLGIDELIGTAQGTLQNIAAGVVAGLPFTDLALTEKPADMGIVSGKLFDRLFLLLQNLRFQNL